MQNEELKQAVKLTEEQIAKAAAAKTPAEVLALAQEEGVPLTNDQLEAISGGGDWGEVSGAVSQCPRCGNFGLKYMGKHNGERHYECPDCGGFSVD